jgi:hypothetical protein
MPGLVPGIHALRKRIEQIVPSRIETMNGSNFPSARPMLHRFLALNRTSHIIVPFVVYKSFQAITFGEAFDESFTVLICSANQIIRDANVENAVPFVRSDVDEATAHIAIQQGVDGRDKPGHDDITFLNAGP